MICPEPENILWACTQKHRVATITLLHRFQNQIKRYQPTEDISYVLLDEGCGLPLNVQSCLHDCMQ